MLGPSGVIKSLNTLTESFHPQAEHSRLHANVGSRCWKIWNVMNLGGICHDHFLWTKELRIQVTHGLHCGVKAAVRTSQTKDQIHACKEWQASPLGAVDPARCTDSPKLLSAQSLSLQIRLEELHDASSDKVNCGMDGCPNEVVDGVVNGCSKAGRNAVTSNVFGGAFNDLLEPGFQVLKPLDVRSNMRPNSLDDETQPKPNVVCTDHHHQHSLRQPPSDECSNGWEGNDLCHDGPASRDYRA